MHIAATELNKNTGRVINMALQGPVIIEKAGHPTVVMISYEHFLELEDVFWGSAAEGIEKNAQWLSAEESNKFLRE